MIFIATLKKLGEHFALPIETVPLTCARLEAKPQHELNDARVPAVDRWVEEPIARRVAWDDIGERAECRVVSWSRYGELRMIEHVEHLGAELHLLGFTNREILKDGQVPVVDLIRADDVAPGSSKRACIAANPSSVRVSGNIGDHLTGRHAVDGNDLARPCDPEDVGSPVAVAIRVEDAAVARSIEIAI